MLYQRCHSFCNCNHRYHDVKCLCDDLALLQLKVMRKGVMEKLDIVYLGIYAGDILYFRSTNVKPLEILNTGKLHRFLINFVNIFVSIEYHYP